MAGIYIHIPLCKKICYYCDFYFSVSFRNKKELLQSIHKELLIRKDFFGKSIIDTIYFGGGTPSVLTIHELQDIMEIIYKQYKVSYNAEITLETNPDDLFPKYLRGLKDSGFNRLSIGIQSFRNEDLLLMNRRHNAKDAEYSVLNANNAGFENITIDLMYGLPNMNMIDWEKNLEKAFDLNIKHLSAYNLTIEKQTAFNTFVKRKQIVIPNDDECIKQFILLQEYAKEHSFMHYEISNFGLGNYFSKHNLGYWQQKKYLGIGPSAHSYDGNKRYWNIANNLKYIEALNHGMLRLSEEVLGNEDKYNEYVMTSLRTMWGISYKYVSDNFGDEFLDFIQSSVYKYLKSNDIIEINNFILLTESGKLLADKIASDLFYTDTL